MKRYVVFVSSTVKDLEEERRSVSQALLRAKCFPSQMENWPAIDAQQLVAIKEMIDECDYYLILTAGKYGAIHPDHEVSYTEWEYDYALRAGKPIIRLVHKDPFNLLRGEKIDTDPEQLRRLVNFREKLRSNSIVHYWDDPSQLKFETLSALNDLIARHPANGWRRVLTVEDAVEQNEKNILISALAKQISSQSTDRQSAISTLPIPTLILEEDGLVRSHNDAALQLVGDQLQEGSFLGEFMESFGRPIGEWLRDTLEGRVGRNSDFLRLRRDDKEVIVQVTLNPIEATYGTGLIAVLNDATELKTLEMQFVQSQKMQATGQLAGAIAHDFNNLLTAISNSCDHLLLRHDEGDPNYTDLVQINRNVTEAAALISQLLAFSRKQVLEPNTIDAGETLADLTHLLNRLVGERVSLLTTFDPALPPIRADKRQLEQVLMNLVVNARDAMPNGGEIRLACELANLFEPLSRDKLTVPAGSYVSLTVSVHGVGILSDNLENTFEPFHTTKRTNRGTGLGLSTVYGFVKQTGGFVFVDSTVGDGSKFTVLLPVLQDGDENGD